MKRRQVLNLYTTGSDGSSIALLTADGAPQGVSQNFGKSLSLKNGLGAEAVVQIKNFQRRNTWSG